MHREVCLLGGITSSVPAVQTGMPMPALSVLGASWRLKPEERSLLLGTYIPWALHAGSRSADLMCLYYERHFEVSILHLTRDCALASFAAHAMRH